eukprot:4225346-Karenia_brevis.AAC.1
MSWRLLVSISRPLYVDFIWLLAHPINVCLCFLTATFCDGCPFIVLTSQQRTAPSMAFSLMLPRSLTDMMLGEFEMEWHAVDLKWNPLEHDIPATTSKDWRKLSEFKKKKLHKAANPSNTFSYTNSD